MVNIFGNKDALIGSVELLFGAIFVIGALIFRKSVANDMMDTGFSVIGASAAGVIGFILCSAVFDFSLKISVVIGLAAWAAGGFLLAEIIGDGYADGGST